MSDHPFSIGDQVVFPKYDDPTHVDYGIVATVADFRRFQNASNDDWYWCARIEYVFDGDAMQAWYPVRFLRAYRRGKVK